MVSQRTLPLPASIPTIPLTNQQVAQKLERVAELLESQNANPFRVQAYRHAAQTISDLNIPLAAVAKRLVRGAHLSQEKSETFETSSKRKAESGKPQEKSETFGTSTAEHRGFPLDSSSSGQPSLTDGTFAGKTAAELLAEKLQSLNGIGESLAETISGLVLTGRWELLEQLKADASYASILSTVPGIGAELADRIHAKLGIETLPELAAAAYDGRLSHVPGFGPKRLRAVRESLSGRFHRTAQDFQKAARQTEHDPLLDEPPVSELLSIDEQYRRQAAEGILPKVAPKKFNPTHAAWLPVLSTQRNGRQYTAMYSNTARAHDLGTTHDWVVIHRSDAKGRGLWTVVTSTFGPHKGERVVRGREEEHE